MNRASVYKLSKKIARGGMAEIFLASKKGPDGFRRICCIKSILPHYATEKEFVDMFRDEAKLCQSLQHANIVRVEDFQQVNNSWAIIMEYVAGSDLRALLAACEKNKRSFSMPMVCWIGAEVARGLHYAHTKLDELTGRPLGIVHRDVSPQNIMISFEGEVKLTDFGIAEAEHKVNETKPGMVKGKYAYMSPEQIIAKPVDARTDVFALGVVLWEAVAMKRLFHSEVEANTVDMVKNCRLPENFQYPNGAPVDPDFKNIIYKALQKEPSERWRTAGEFEQALRKYLYGRFPDFGAHELALFSKQVMPAKFAEIKDQIKEALSAVDAEDNSQTQATDRLDNKDLFKTGLKKQDISDISSSIFGEANEKNAPKSENSQLLKLNIASTNSASFSKKKPGDSAINKIQNEQNSWASPKNRGKTSRESFGISKFLIAVVILAGLVSLALTMNSYMAAKPTVSELTLKFDPTRVLVEPLTAMDVISPSKNPIQLDPESYVKGSITFRLEPGDHELMVRRDGYEPKKVKVKVNPGTGKTVNVVLKKNGIMAPVTFMVDGEKAVSFAFEKNLDSGTVKPGVKLNIPDLLYNRTYKVRFSVEGSPTEFSCNFAPRSQNWTNPFIVTIIPSRKTCQAQLPF